jgi:uncharacterized membrane-anchored protein
VSHTDLFIDQPEPLRTPVQAENGDETGVTSTLQGKTTPVTPVTTPVAQGSLTPVAASIATGDKRVSTDVTPVKPIDVHDPAVQAMLDYDNDIPF